MSSRFRMVPYWELPQELQATIWQRYPNGVEWIPYEEYSYPLKRNGQPANAGRHVSYERAKELKDAYDVRKVMES